MTEAIVAYFVGGPADGMVYALPKRVPLWQFALPQRSACLPFDPADEARPTKANYVLAYDDHGLPRLNERGEHQYEFAAY